MPNMHEKEMETGHENYVHILFNITLLLFPQNMHGHGIAFTFQRRVYT